MKKKKPDSISWFPKTVYLRKAGIGFSPARKSEKDIVEIEELPKRVQMLLDIIKKPKSGSDMLFIIMYDIEDNKVRTQVAKYLVKAGCVRIQKSVYVAQLQRKKYADIKETLSDVQQMYENNDSILMVPVSTDELKAMNIIGKNIDITLFTDPPNTIFF